MNSESLMAEKLQFEATMEIYEQEEKLSLHETIDLARNLMDRHGLQEWSLILFRGKKQIGLCSESRKWIKISSNLIQYGNRKQIEDTILHEIAHALVGSKHLHDDVWKIKANEIGATPERYCKEKIVPGRWIAYCKKNCFEHPHYLYRKPKREYLCKKCYETLIFKLRA